MPKRRRELQQLRDWLAQRREALRQALGDDWQSDEAVPDNASDPADAATASNVQEMHYQAVEMELRELALIEWALRKFQEGSYGVCECCGGQISLARLQVLPYARFCIDCQRELEEYGATDHGRAAHWQRVYDMERSLDEPQVDLSDLEAEHR